MSTKVSNPKGQQQQQQQAMKIRPDPYARLLSHKNTIRVQAAVALIQDIQKNHKRDQEKANEDDTTVELTQLGLTKHLDYVLNRLLAGLESTDRFATIGFSTALAMVLQTFDENVITPDTLEKMILQRHTSQSYHALTNKEQQSFDLGCLFLIQTLDRVGRLSTLTQSLLSRLLAGVSRLAQKNPQMVDLCINAVSKLAESCFLSSSHHYNSILSALTQFIPKYKKSAPVDGYDGDAPEKPSKSNEIKNKHVPVELSRWDAGSIAAALALRRLGKSELYSTAFPGFFEDEATWDTIWALLVPTLPLYPNISTVWVQLLTDSLSIPGHFQSFWAKVIGPNLADEYAYHKRGTAMAIINNFLQHLLQLSIETPSSPLLSSTTLQLVINTVLSNPDLIKTVMNHARANDTPLYLQSVTLLATIESFCQQFKFIIPTIIAIFSSPTKGGSRAFDGKSGTKFMASITTLLDKTELISYIQETIANFHNAEAIIEADIRHVAELTRDRQESIGKVDKKDEKSDDKKKSDKNDKKAKDAQDDDEKAIESVTATDFSKIADVDTFMTSEIAKRALSQGIAALHTWTVDHVYHLCELLFKLQRAARHNLTKQQKETAMVVEEETTVKGKKGSAATKKNSDKKPVEESEFSIDSEELETCLQSCIIFLYTHAFYKSSESASAATTTTKKASAAKKTKKSEDLHNITIQSVSPRCQEVCQQRFISLFSTLLLADGHYHPRTALSLAFGPEETRWGVFILQTDEKLRNVHKFTLQVNPSTINLTKSLQDTTHTITVIDDWVEKMMVKYTKERADAKSVDNIKLFKQYIDLATMLKYVITTSFSLLYSELSVLASILSDLKIVTYKIQQQYLKDAPRGTKLSSSIELTKEEQIMVSEDVDDSPWVDVILDILLSIMGLGHNVTRAVVLKSFTLLVPHLEMSSITLLIDPIAQAIDDDGEEEEEEEEQDKKAEKKAAKTDNSMNDDDLLDFSSDDDSDADFSDMTDDENEELGDVIRKFTQAGHKINVDQDVDEDDEQEVVESDEEIDVTETADILLDHKSSKISKEQEDAIAGIVRIQKEHHRQQKNKVHAVMLMKLRILDLIEVLINEMFATNTWLSLLLPMIVLIKNTRNNALSALQTKATNLFKTKLCSMLNTNGFITTTRQEKDLTEQDSISKYILIDETITNPETLIQPQDIAHGDNVQAILDAIFDSLRSTVPSTTSPTDQKQQNNTELGAALDRTTMAGYALAAVASLYLIAPAGPMEFAKVQPSTATKKGSKATKKSPSTTASALNKDELQIAIYKNRVDFFTKGFLPLLSTQFVNTKREYFSQNFFKLIFDAPIVAGTYMWTQLNDVSAFSLLQGAVTEAQTPFLRKQATEALASLFKQVRIARNNNDSKSLYDQVGKCYTASVASYQDAIVAYEKAVAIPVIKQEQIKQEKGKKQPKQKKAVKNVNHQRETTIQGARAHKLGLQAAVERSKAAVLALEQEMKITKSIIVQKAKDVKPKEEQKPATPIKKVETPVKKVATPVKKEETPVKKEEAKVKTPTKGTPVKKAAVEVATPSKKAKEDVVEKKTTKATTASKKITMIDSDEEKASEESDDFDEVPAPVKKSTTTRKSTVKKAPVEEEEEEAVVEEVKPKRAARSTAKKVEEKVEVEPSTPRKRQTAPVAQQDDDEEDAGVNSTPRRSTRLRR